MEVSQSDFAKIAGVTKQRINALVKQGRITLTPNRKIHVETGLRQYRENLNPDYQAKARLDVMLANVAGQPPVAQPMPSAPVAEDSTYRDAKTRHEQLKADLAALDYEKQRGMLLPKQEVIEAMVTSGRKIRQAIENVAGWADEICALGQVSPVEMRKFLIGKIRVLQQAAADSLNMLGHEAEAPAHDDA